MKKRKRKKIIKRIEEKPDKKIVRCPYISPIILECNVGGDAHLGCLHPSFHENCEVKQRFELNERARRKL